MAHVDPLTEPEFAPVPDSKAAHDPYAALRVRDYRLYLATSVLSTIGGEMQMVAVGWELYERTHSAMNLGFVGLALGMPFLVLALPGGQLADRVSRRKVIVAANVAMALASLGLAGLSRAHGPIAWMYACLTMAGAASAFSMPARGRSCRSWCRRRR